MFKNMSEKPKQNTSHQENIYSKKSEQKNEQIHLIVNKININGEDSWRQPIPNRLMKANQNNFYHLRDGTEKTDDIIANTLAYLLGLENISNDDSIAIEAYIDDKKFVAHYSNIKGETAWRGKFINDEEIKKIIDKKVDAYMYIEKHRPNNPELN